MRRLLRCLKRLVKPLTLLLVCTFIVHGIFTLIAGRKVKAEIAKIRALGEPVTFGEIKLPTAPAPDNAAIAYEESFRTFKSMREQAGKVAYVEPNLENWECLDESPVHFRGLFFPWNDASFALPRYGKLLDMIEVANRLPSCSFHFDNKRPWSEQQIRVLRPITDDLRNAAYMNARYGKQKDAVRCVCALAGINNHLISKPLADAYEYRTTIACQMDGAIRDIARFDRINEAIAQQLVDAVDQLRLEHGFREAMLDNRTRTISWYQLLLKIKVEPCLCDEWIRERYQQSYPYRPRFYKDELYCLQNMAKEIGHADQSCREMGFKPLGSGDYSDYSKKAPSYVVFATDELGGMQRLRSTRDLSMAYIAADKTFLELIIYHYRFGDFPNTLDELESRLNIKLPKDPFSGKRLVYKRTGKGFLVYSFGMNLKDDGGYIKERADDIVWKMTDDPSRVWHPIMQPHERKFVRKPMPKLPTLPTHLPPPPPGQ